MRTRPRSNQNAFTLIELLVACLIFGTGVLALASTSVAVARLTGDAAREGLAAERGQARMEGMRAARCAAASGSVVSAGIGEWWSAAGRTLSDSIQYSVGAHHDERSASLTSGAWCP
jgi:prepilin-type N-terminal cleavage/methylation domain-containing protein